jgi:hypothetical protein
MGEVGGHGGMFSTHPAPQDRIASLGGAVAWTGDPVAAEARLQRYRSNLKL